MKRPAWITNSLTSTNKKCAHNTQTCKFGPKITINHATHVVCGVDISPGLDKQPHTLSVAITSRAYQRGAFMLSKHQKTNVPRPNRKNATDHGEQAREMNSNRSRGALKEIHKHANADMALKHRDHSILLSYHSVEKLLNASLPNTRIHIINTRFSSAHIAKVVLISTSLQQESNTLCVAVLSGYRQGRPSLVLCGTQKRVRTCFRKYG
jgi:hypothetical protein